MNLKTYLHQKGLSKSTVKHYYMYVMDFLSFLDKDNLPANRYDTETENATAKEVLLYLNHLQKKGINNDTKKIRLYALKHYFSYQIDSKQRTDNPAKKIKINAKQRQKIYPTLKPQELQALYQNYKVPKDKDKRSHHNWFTAYKLSRERNKVILSLFINQGITTAEVSRIQIGDLDLRKGEIHIRGGRIGKDRTLPLQSSQIIDLMEYQYQTRNKLLEYHNSPPLEGLGEVKQLFLSVPGVGKTQVDNPNTLNIWKSLSKELKEQNSKFINLRQIRTSVIINWLKQYNLREVQYKAGHRNIYSTEMYLINDIDVLQAEIEKHHPIR